MGLLILRAAGVEWGCLDSRSSMHGIEGTAGAGLHGTHARATVGCACGASSGLHVHRIRVGARFRQRHPAARN